MMYRLYILTFWLLFMLPELFAQSNKSLLYRAPQSEKALLRLAVANPELSKERSRQERKIIEFGNEYNLSDFDKYYKDSLPPLPLVFHVLYKDATERVSAAQIMSQIEALNRDFGVTKLVNNPFFTYKDKVSPGTIISFCLADGKGNSKSAINYYSVEKSDWTLDDFFSKYDLGSNGPWDSKRYINVWVANLADDFAGFAQMPGGPDRTDGIVIDYQMFGIGGTSVTPYNMGKTMTHLMGNYLNLFSLWGEYPCGDDYVWDTPIHNAPNFEYFGRGHVSTCGDNPFEMLENFMDSSPDSVRTLFTYGQVMRMYSTLTKNGSRHSLTKGNTQCGQPKSDPVTDRGDSNASNVKNTEVSIFPNPADGLINITVSDRTTLLDLQIFNAMGQLIFTQRDMSDAASVNCQHWPEGLYLLSFFKSGKLLITKTVDVKRP